MPTLCGMFRVASVLVSFLVILSVAVTSCVGVGPDENGELLPVTLPNGTKFLVEVANTDASREQGLMHRDHLPDDRGMLFVFESEDIWSFWMKNTLIPLDVVWLDGDGRIVDVAEGMQPCKTVPCPLYHPEQLSSFALEIGAGRYQEEGLQSGMILEFPRP